MIFFETIFFLAFSFFSIYSFAGLGNLILNNVEKNFFENIFFGFIVSTFVITLMHFFLRIDLYVVFLVFAFGFYNAIKKFKLLKYNFKKNFIYLIIFLIFVPIFLNQKYHEDFGYYHLPYVINFFNEKIIFGMANFNSAFLHNSIWLNLMSLFNLGNNFNFLTLPTFLIYVFFIIFSLRNIFDNKNYKISNYFLIVSIFYLMLKFTRISEYGTDLPATIFSLLSVFYFLRYFELTDINLKISYFYLILSFTIFSILIKYSCIPLLILVIFIFFKDFKYLKREIFKYNYIFIYLFVFLFFIQQFIYSGCLIFPSEFSCFNVSWYNEEFLKWKSTLELTNKSFASAKHEISKEDYLLNYNWVSYWFKRNYIEISEHLLTMFVPLIIFLLILKNDIKKYQNNKHPLIFFVFILFGLIFWFTFSPVYRFSIIYFISLIFLITLSTFLKKQFSKKIFTIFLSIIVIFNFSKNVTRISKKDNINFAIEKINNNSISLSNANLENIRIYKPDIKKNNENGWQGRLCWDIPFICTYSDVTVRKKYGYLFVNK